MGGSRYPYPKEVWSPSGGWWTRPANWKSNTAICCIGAAMVVYTVWNVSSEKEFRHNPPNRWIPSMLWAKQYRDQKLEAAQTTEAKAAE